MSSCNLPGIQKAEWKTKCIIPVLFLVLVRELIMGLQDVAFLPSRASFHTTLKKNCGRG